MKRRKVKFSLKYKITILIFTLIIITMGIILTYSLNMNYKLQRREMRRSAKQVSDTLSALRLVTSWKTKEVNWKIYKKYMEILSKLDKNILLMAILDEKGDIKAYSINENLIKKDFKEIKIKKDKDEFIKELLNKKIKDVLKVKGKIKIKGEKLSEIIIKFSKKSYVRKMNITILNMLILTIILLTAGFIGSWFLSNLITKNFNIIANGMRKVAMGNLDVAVDVKSNDEVGVLADDFNRMIVELREKVRIKDAFDTVAEGLKDMENLKKAYKLLTYQDMTDKITKGYIPPLTGKGEESVFVFIDISSFLNLSFELISEEMKQIIEKFVEKISLTTLEFQGAVFKVTDRYILLSFGYPFKHSDDVKRAAISIVNIRKELVKMVKSKLTLGYNIEEFYINFIILKGAVINNFIDKNVLDMYNAIIDYLSFAAKYSKKKKYSTDIYTIDNITKETESLAVYEKIDNITLGSSDTVELYRLKAVKF